MGNAGPLAFAAARPYGNAAALRAPLLMYEDLVSGPAQGGRWLAFVFGRGKTITEARGTHTSPVCAKGGRPLPTTSIRLRHVKVRAG